MLVHGPQKFLHWHIGASMDSRLRNTGSECTLHILLPLHSKKTGCSHKHLLLYKDLHRVGGKLIKIKTPKHTIQNVRCLWQPCLYIHTDLTLHIWSTLFHTSLSSVSNVLTIILIFSMWIWTITVNWIKFSKHVRHETKKTKQKWETAERLFWRDAV